MIKMEVKKNFDIGKMVRAIPKETANLLNDIADATIMDIRKGVEEGKDIHGKRFKKLKKSTIASKKAAGYPHPKRALQATNLMVGVGKQGGRRGIYVKTRATAQKLLAVVTTAAQTPQAVYHQLGTPPYTITPKRAKVLVFTGSSGEMVFASKVKHPGLSVREWFGFSRRMEKKTDILIRAAEERLVKAADTPMK